jgi:hypothetical protein
MNVEEIIVQVHRCGAALTVIDGRLKAAPPGVLPLELKAAIRERAAEIKARLAGDRRSEQSCAETATLPPLLTAIADAVVSARRSPFLDDLAVARAARAYVEVERAIRDAPPVLSAEIATVVVGILTSVTAAIRQNDYQTAHESLDTLTIKMRNMRAQ